MDSIKNRLLTTAVDDPDYQALKKMSRRENAVKTLFLGLGLLTLVPVSMFTFLSIAVYFNGSFGDKDTLNLQYFLQYLFFSSILPILFFGLSELSGRIGERILDWKAEKEAWKKTQEVISRASQK